MIIVEKSEATAPLEITIDQEGVGGVTGLTAGEVVARIREQDTVDSFLDFSDGVFKTVGWTSKELNLNEVGQGHYQETWDVNSSGAAVGDFLVAEFTIDDGATILGEANDIILVVDSIYDIPTSVTVPDPPLVGSGKP